MLTKIFHFELVREYDYSSVVAQVKTNSHYYNKIGTYNKISFRWLIGLKFVLEGIGQIQTRMWSSAAFISANPTGF